MFARSGEITASLRSSFIRLDFPAIFHHTRLQPFLDEADDPAITDPVLHECDQPFVANRIKEPRDVGIEDPVYLASCYPDIESIQRLVLAASCLLYTSDAAD